MAEVIHRTEQTPLDGSSVQVDIQIRLTNTNILIDLRQSLIKVAAFGTTTRDGHRRLQRCSCPSRKGATGSRSSLSAVMLLVL